MEYNLFLACFFFCLCWFFVFVPTPNHTPLEYMCPFKVRNINRYILYNGIHGSGYGSDCHPTISDIYGHQEPRKSDMSYAHVHTSSFYNKQLGGGGGGSGHCPTVLHNCPPF